MARAELLIDAQKVRGEFDAMEGGKFYPLRGGKGVSYTEQIREDGHMEKIFLVEAGADAAGEPRMVIVVAERGEPKRSDQGQAAYLVLSNGHRYQGVPGRADFEVTQFAEYGQRLPKPTPRNRPGWSESVPTSVLRRSTDPEHVAALQWRYSTALLVLVVTLMAVPLSRTDPRKGRFAHILPAVFLYIAYLVSLNAARGAVEAGAVSPALGLWWIHLLFLGIGAGLMLWWTGWRPRRPGAGLVRA